jgi:hypothetical protein
MPTLPAPLLGASYTPLAPGRNATCRCGASFRHPVMIGRLPLDGPCCAKPKGPKRPRAIHTPPRFTAREIVGYLNRPGWASIRFEGGATVFVGATAYQGDTVPDAIAAAVDGGGRV